MSIVAVEMFSIVCDHCGETYRHGEGWTCFPEPEDARMCAMEADWTKHEGKDYCFDCVDICDDDGKLVLIESRKK